MIPSCIACNKINCLKYLVSDTNVLLCNECGAIQLEDEFQKKIHLTDFPRNPNFLEKIINRLIDVRVYGFQASEYFAYLKSKTDMNFHKALEIGSRFGSFVKELQKNNIDAYGIEAEQKAVKLSVTNKIKWGYFDKNYQSKEKFDLICLTQMITYVRDNYELLIHVKKLLNKDGIVFITTQNPESRFVRENLKMDANKHVANMIFSKKNYESLGSKIGLSLIDYTPYSDFHHEIFESKNKKLSALKYYLGFKKAYWADPKGNHVFILLKNIL